MKYIYLVDYWVPFPSSEYGGMISVIAEDDQECFDLLTNFDEGETNPFDPQYEDRVMPNIVKAPKFALVDDEESRVIDIFLT
jgi:hypothetical protein